MPAVAVVDESGVVVNIIIADPDRDELRGLTLVEVPGDASIDSRWLWTEEQGFQPTPALIDEMRARRFEWREDERAFKPNAEMEAELEIRRQAWRDMQESGDG